MTVPDWDPYGSEMAESPTDTFRALRASCPVAYTETEVDGPFWSLFRYGDIAKVCRDLGTFVNGMNPKMNVRRPPLESDRPEHSWFRRVLQPFFAPKMIRRLEGSTREIAHTLLEPLLADRGGDLAARFTYPMPVQVLCRFLNVRSGAEEIKYLSDQVWLARYGPDPCPERLEESNARLMQICAELVDSRRSEPHDPATDMATALLQARLDGDPIPPETVIAILRLMISAGHDSTTSALGICLRHLGTHVEDQQALRAQPASIPAAIDEMLRLETPVQAMPRYVARPTEVGGRHLEPGDRVMLVWGAANRDPEVFDEPSLCNIERRPNRHLTFGYGVHKCIGLPLAMMELRVAVECLLSATRHFEVSGEVERTGWPRFGVSRLPVELVPSA